MSDLSFDSQDRDDYLTANDMVEMLGMSIKTVYKLCRIGAIPAKKLGREWRISRREFERCMQKRESYFREI